jgi:hypothetical protein
VGKKLFMVADGKMLKAHSGIGSIVFSPDSRRLAYGAREGSKRFLVVDQEEGKSYDAMITVGGGKVVFDTPHSLNYLAVKGNQIYLVEERVKDN